MTEPSTDLDARLLAERAAFDGSFAAQPATAGEARVRLLTLRAGHDRFAVRLSEVCGLHRDRRVVPLASDAPALIGIAGLRARVLPVFSLARLLGYAEADPPRWLIVCGEDEGAIALAFAGFEGHRELAASALHAAGVAEGRAHVREVARGADGVLPVVSATSIRAAITAAGRPVAA